MAVATLVRRAATPAAVVLLWEVLARAGALDVRFIPPPSRVAATWAVWVLGGGPAADPYSGTWLLAARDSAYRVGLGFLVAAAAGIAIGALVGWYRLGEDLLDPLIQIARPIPITAWVPFAIIFFGFYTASAVFLIALGAFFPVFVNTAAGVRRVPTVLVRAARMLGTPPGRVLPRVALPAALPYILTGLRIGMGAAWVLVIVSEMVAVKSGLGYSLWNAYYFLRMDVIIAAMASVGGLGFLSDRLLLWISRPLLRWSEGD
jgi:NitT/TauT family transport system permease protein